MEWNEETRKGRRQSQKLGRETKKKKRNIKRLIDNPQLINLYLPVILFDVFIIIDFDNLFISLVIFHSFITTTTTYTPIHEVWG